MTSVLSGLAYFCLMFYVSSMTFVAMFCLMQLHLLSNFLKFYDRYKIRNGAKKNLSDNNLPHVTIQLPIFNEQYVVERLIDTIAKISYPKEKLQIQILDDSTDETLQVSQRKVDEYRKLGFDISLHHRENRQGFKAGALKQGLDTAKGEFIAIFDADFLPNSDFLYRTLPKFEDGKVGVVQTRWGHINQDYSLLTELQAFQLNVHFTIEQGGRYEGDYFLQFNGTAGVWRKTTIEDAGGWEADTLTEDLDLSYRAQLKGWKIEFLVDVTSPAELPVEMNGLKSQQYRWMKGGAENARKLLPNVWQSDLGLISKLHASVHLLSSSVYLCIFFIGFFSIPLMLLLPYISISLGFFNYFLGTLLLVIVVYFIANVLIAWEGSMLKKILKFGIIFPLFISLSMGLAFHNTLAVLSGWLGRKSDFIRTPKYGIMKQKQAFRKTNYFKDKKNTTLLFEGIFGILFLACISYGILYGNTYFTILHTMLACGYLSIFGYGLAHFRK